MNEIAAALAGGKAAANYIRKDTNMAVKNKQNRKKISKKICARWQIYLLLLLPLIHLVMFHYIPMGGLVLAFKDYSIRDGIWGSPWVGVDNFAKFFGSYKFPVVIKNTMTLSFYSLIASFPLPVIFALLLNAMRGKNYKKVIQTVTYIPHFISTVVMVGLINQLLDVRSGIYGSLYRLFTGSSAPRSLLAVGTNFKHVYVWSGIWQNLGYNSIIYIAALTSVDQSLHEAAQIDGASRFQRMIHIDFPAILPTTSIMLILAIGRIMNVGYEKTLLLQNGLNLDYSEIISTYVYKIGLASGLNDFSLSTTVGMFNAVINLILLLTANWGSKKLSGSGIF